MLFRQLFFSLLFAAHSLSIFGQSCFDELKAQPVFTEIDEGNYSDKVKEIQEKMQCFIGLQLDSIDIAILSDNQILGIVLMDLLDENPQMTYGLMHTAFVEFTQDEEYRNNKLAMYSMIQLFPKVASLGSWEKDKELMVRAGFLEQDIAKARGAVEKYENGILTYREVFELLEQEESSYEEFSTDIFEKQNSYIPSVKLQEAIDEGMPLVLYFADYEDPNCMKLQDRIKEDEEFMYYFHVDLLLVTIYCNDETVIPLEHQYFSSALNRKVITDGDQALHILKSKYGQEKRPYMVALDGYGQKIAELSYTGSDEEIYSFLERIDALFYDIEPVEEGE